MESGNRGLGKVNRNTPHPVVGSGANGDRLSKHIHTPGFADLDNVGKALLDGIWRYGAHVQPNMHLTSVLQVAENGAADHIAGGKFATGVVGKGKTLSLVIQEVRPLTAHSFAN
jgi:hypothetical protein